MGLKVAINGEKKVIASRKTRPVVFINGQKKRLAKGLTFVNGQKKYLWGTESRIEFFNFEWDLGDPDNAIIAIDESRMTVFGDRYIRATSTGGYINPTRMSTIGRFPGSSIGGTVLIQQSNYLTTFDISNVSAGSSVQSLQWGELYHIVNPNESDETTTVWYSCATATRNRIVYTQGADTPVVDGTYASTGQSNLAWCVPLPDGKNLWGIGSNLGYNSTTVSTSATIGYPTWDGTNTVFTGGSAIYRCTASGCAKIITVANYNTIYVNKMADGDNLLVAGYNNGSTSAKLIKFDSDGTLLWEYTLDGDSATNPRRAKIVCRSGDLYYVLDEPVSTTATDLTVYLRIFTLGGQLYGFEKLPYSQIAGTKITDWKVSPRRIESDYAGLFYYAGGYVYVVRIFVG